LEEESGGGRGGYTRLWIAFFWILDSCNYWNGFPILDVMDSFLGAFAVMKRERGEGFF
jgi:hypothetical protein